MTNKKLVTYLCGPMEACPDGGVQWRDRITPKLEALGIEVRDPTKNETKKTGYDFQECRKKLMGWKLSGNYDSYKEVLSKILYYDIKDVEESSFLICHYDEKVRFDNNSLIEDYLKQNTERDFKSLLLGFLDYMDKNGYMKMAMGGTICEVWHAYHHRIPVYTVTYNTKAFINDWMHYTLMDAGEVFNNYHQLMEFIQTKYSKSERSTE